MKLSEKIQYLRKENGLTQKNLLDYAQSVNNHFSISLYEGALVKESIDNESILDYLDINKVKFGKQMMSLDTGLCCFLLLRILIYLKNSQKS